MLILDGTIGSDVQQFLTRLQEETVSQPINLYEKWLASHSACTDHDHDHPEGIIFLRVLPEIAFKRISSRTSSPENAINLDEIKRVYAEKESLFIENKNSPASLRNLPVLVLNGNIDFQTDFAQFYNHLFYIRKFINEIDKRREIALGIYKEKENHRRCC